MHFDAQSKDCHFEGIERNQSGVIDRTIVWFRKSKFRVLLVGIFIGFLITLVVCIIGGLLLWKGCEQPHKTCTENENDENTRLPLNDISATTIGTQNAYRTLTTTSTGHVSTTQTYEKTTPSSGPTSTSSTENDKNTRLLVKDISATTIVNKNAYRTLTTTSTGHVSTTPTYEKTTPSSDPTSTTTTTVIARNSQHSDKDVTTELTMGLGFCQITGGCNSPPTALKGFGCLFEASDKRATVKYTATEKEPVTTFNHCPVSYCTGGNIWSSFNVSSSESECYTVLEYYTFLSSGYRAVYSGKNTCTETGRICQRWDEDFPHSRDGGHIPTDIKDFRSNYCRDPGPPHEGRPWCYTTDPQKRWEHCHVPRC